jgi:hypothetical protein
MGIAIVATAAVVLLDRLDDAGRARALRVLGALGLGVVVVSSAFFARDAAYTDVPNPPVTRSVREVAPPTVAALRAGELPGTGEDGRYYVTWTDPYSIGGRGYSLFVELEREGFDVGANESLRVGVRPHRVMDPGDATAHVRLVSGGAIERQAREPGFERVAYYDPRSPAEREEYEELRDRVERELRAEGLGDIAEGIANGNLGVTFSTEIPPRLRADVNRLLSFGVPLAVFVGPAEG